MADLASTCKDKLAYFRIKEVKDILNQLGSPKQGKKQKINWHDGVGPVEYQGRRRPRAALLHGQLQHHHRGARGLA